LFQHQRRLWRRSKSAANRNPKPTLAVLTNSPNTNVRNKRADVIVRAAFKGDFDFTGKLLKGTVLAQMTVSRKGARRHVKNFIRGNTRKRAADDPTHHRPARSQSGQTGSLNAPQKFRDLPGWHTGNFDSLARGQMRACRPLALFGQVSD
jgi:hypothetical protein